MLVSNVIITSHEATHSYGSSFKWGEGYQEPGEFTQKINTFYQLVADMPRIPLGFLGMGGKEECNYKPKLIVGNVGSLNVNSINKELTQVANNKINHFIKDWIWHLYIERNFKLHTKLEDAINKGVILLTSIEEKGNILSRFNDEASLKKFHTHNLSKETQEKFLSQIEYFYKTIRSISCHDHGFCCYIKYENGNHLIGGYSINTEGNCWW